MKIIKFESDKASLFPYLYAQPRWVIQQCMEEDEQIITNRIDVRISLTPQRQNKIIILGKANYDMKLIQAIVKSFWYNKLGAERKLPIEARNGNNKRLRKLRFLPPEIIESIMNGTQDPELNIKKLIEMAEKTVL